MSHSSTAEYNAYDLVHIYIVAFSFFSK